MQQYSNSSKKILMKPYADMKNFMIATVNRNIELLQSELEIQVIKVITPPLVNNAINLRNLTSVINIYNFYKTTLVFSYDAQLINEIFRKYTKSIVIENIDLQYFIKQTSCDMINIIVGNILSEFEHTNKVFQLSVPLVVINSSNIKKCNNKKVYLNEIITEFGKMSIFCIVPKRFFFIPFSSKKESEYHEKP